MSFLQIPIGTYPNTFLGYQSSVSMTTGGQNTAFGFQTLNANTTGDQNAAFGHLALSQNTTGRTSVAMGFNALFNQTTGFENVAIGHASAGGLTTGQGNIAIGAGASVGNLGSSGNITIGRSAGYVTTVNECVLIGNDSGNVNQGSNNTFIGTNSGGQITTGAKNTIVGSFRGNQFGLDIRTLSNHIVLSDGDGNPRLWINNTGAVNIPGGLALTGSLSITGGTVTANNPVLSATQTWNNAAVTFTGWQLNVTDTASNAASLLMDLQVGGVSRISFGKGAQPAGGVIAFGATQGLITGNNSIGIQIKWAASFVNIDSTGVGINTSGLTYLATDANNILALRNGVNAQTLRVYNTFTDASNYERGRFAWASNVLTIGTENAGTGLARELAFITGGVEQARLNSTGFGIGTNSPTSKLEVQGVGVLVSFLSTNNNNVVRIRGNNATNGAWIGTSNADDFIISTGPSIAERVRIPGNGGMVVGTAALATNATDGFLYVAGCAGTPTGTPTAYTGRVPIVVDTTNNKLYFYSGGAWRDAGP